MDKIFGPAYTGDPGVPHSGDAPFEGLFWGTMLYTGWTMVNPYHWNRGTAINWHDWAMVCENHAFKRASRLKKPYSPKWNKIPGDVRDNYYLNWPEFFQ